MMKLHRPDPAPRGYAPRRRPRWWLVGLIVVGHLLLGALLIRLLAPEFTQRMVEQAGRGFTVIVTTPPPTPEPEPEPDAGAAGDPGREATAREVSAPPNPLPSPSPLPRAASTGTQVTSGAREE
ncbi:hypothetical protein M3P36_13170, partial [Altererythrobacter sp. KTW20L]|nr:hypothetical protein [Altererythrobacter sp. KTW20L]